MHNPSAYNKNLINITAYEELMNEVDWGLNEDAKSESGQILQDATVAAESVEQHPPIVEQIPCWICTKTLIEIIN